MSFPSTKPVFNLKGFLFGWFYLLYKKAWLETFAVIVLSLLTIQIAFILHSFLFLGLGMVLPNIVVGFYFYFMYGNKFLKDKESCGVPVDIDCLKERGGTSLKGVIGAIFVIIFLTWPVIYGAITKQDVTIPNKVITQNKN